MDFWTVDFDPDFDYAGRDYDFDDYFDCFVDFLILIVNDVIAIATSIDVLDDARHGAGDRHN